MKRFRVGPEGLAAIPHARDACASVLLAGDLIIFPTDTLYGVGGLAARPEVAEKVARAKGREPGKALPVVASDWDQVARLVGPLSDIALSLAERFWPGPLSLIVTAAPDLPPALLGGQQTIAVRVPDSRIARDLCALAGPLVATSANRSGNPAPQTCDEAVHEIGREVAVALDAGAAARSRPSTLVDVSEGAPRLVREGAIPWVDVLRALA